MDDRAAILLVDDESDLVETYTRLLQRLGFICLNAYNGHGAIALAEQQAPSLLITDLNMPGMDGFDLIRWFRTRWPQVPVIAMTAFHTPQTESSAYLAGAHTYLAKPFSNAELIRSIQLTLSAPGA